MSSIQLAAVTVMALNLYGIDGRETLVAIKNDVGLKKSLLVILSTSANPNYVAFCYQSGANAYHVKPVRIDHSLLLLFSLMQYWPDSVTSHAGSAEFG